MPNVFCHFQTSNGEVKEPAASTSTAAVVAKRPVRKRGKTANESSATAPVNVATKPIRKRGKTANEASASVAAIAATKPLRMRGKPAKREVLSVKPGAAVTAASETGIKYVDLTANETAKTRKRKTLPSKAKPKKSKLEKNNTPVKKTPTANILREAFDAATLADNMELPPALVCSLYLDSFFFYFSTVFAMIAYVFFIFQAVLAENADCTLPIINTNEIDWAYGALNLYDTEENV